MHTPIPVDLFTYLNSNYNDPNVYLYTSLNTNYNTWNIYLFTSFKCKLQYIYLLTSLKPNCNELMLTN